MPATSSSTFETLILESKGTTWRGERNLSGPAATSPAPVSCLSACALIPAATDVFPASVARRLAAGSYGLADVARHVIGE
jgi:hypothetical protein